MIDFSCPICQKQATRVNKLNLLGLIQSSTYHCKNCGVFFRYPLPSESEIKRYYQSRYFRYPDNIEKEMANTQGDWLVNSLNDNYASNESKFNFIEFGCGRGWLVNFMERQPSVVSCVGFDPDEKSVKWGKEHFYIDLRVGTLKEGVNRYNLEHIGDAVPLVTLMHVLEHLHSPLEAINRFKEKYGRHYLFIEVPDGEYEGAVMELDTLSGSSIGQHFWSFSDKSLKLILEKAGYSIVALAKAGNSLFWRNRMDSLKISNLDSSLWKKWDKKGDIGIREAFFSYSKLACLCFLTFLKNCLQTRRFNRLDLPVIRLLAKFE